MARFSSLLPVTEQGFDDTRLPTWGDLDSGNGHWSLQIKWAKVHQCAEQGFRVPLLAVPGSPECPVANLGRLWGALRKLRDNLALFTLPAGGSWVANVGTHHAGGEGLVAVAAAESGECRARLYFSFFQERRMFAGVSQWHGGGGYSTARWLAQRGSAVVHPAGRVEEEGGAGP